MPLPFQRIRLTITGKDKRIKQNLTLFIKGDRRLTKTHFQVFRQQGYIVCVGI